MLNKYIHINEKGQLVKPTNTESSSLPIGEAGMANLKKVSFEF